EGRYEKTGGYEWTRTAATNAFVLEALLQYESGTIFRAGSAHLPPVERAGPGESRACRLPDVR
ncbi:MAG: hypothetical protein JOZ05_24135, partial [Acetobacteraceae bacterium]|nr:hypothetical protein [Acetobacteraceae bacterium]